MGISITSLVLSERFVGVSSDAFRIYLVLRADITTNHTVTAKFSKKNGSLVSGFNVQSIAQLVGLSELTVVRVLDDLARRGWIKRREDDAYQLGVIAGHDEGILEAMESEWFLDVKPEKKEKLSGADPIRKRLEESRSMVAGRKKATAALSDEAAKKLAREPLEATGLIATDIKPSKELYDFYAELYEKKFGTVPILPDGKSDREVHQKKYTYMNRLFKNCSEDLHSTKRLLSWLFNNWDALRAVFRWDEETTVELSLICVKNRITKFNRWILTGIPKPREFKKYGIAGRADKERLEKSPDEGW